MELVSKMKNDKENSTGYQRGNHWIALCITCFYGAIK